MVVPNSQTIAAFINKRLYIPDPSAIDNERNYVQRVRKDDKYTITQFLDRLKHTNMLLSKFPTATESNYFTPT